MIHSQILPIIFSIGGEFGDKNPTHLVIILMWVALSFVSIVREKILNRTKSEHFFSWSLDRVCEAVLFLSFFGALTPEAAAIALPTQMSLRLAVFMLQGLRLKFDFFYNILSYVAGSFLLFAVISQWGLSNTLQMIVWTAPTLMVIGAGFFFWHQKFQVMIKPLQKLFHKVVVTIEGTSLQLEHVLSKVAHVTLNKHVTPFLNRVFFGANTGTVFLVSNMVASTLKWTLQLSMFIAIIITIAVMWA